MAKDKGKDKAAEALKAVEAKVEAKAVKDKAVSGDKVEDKAEVPVAAEAPKASKPPRTFTCSEKIRMPNGEYRTIACVADSIDNARLKVRKAKDKLIKAGKLPPKS